MTKLSNLGQADSIKIPGYCYCNAFLLLKSSQSPLSKVGRSPGAVKSEVWITSVCKGLLISEQTYVILKVCSITTGSIIVSSSYCNTTTPLWAHTNQPCFLGSPLFLPMLHLWLFKLYMFIREIFQRIAITAIYYTVASL